MIAVALRGLWGRKLRATLTAIAIVLGVATVTGTYILTDSISNAFDSIFTGIYRGTDAAITGRSAITSSTSNTELPSFDESLLQKVRQAARGGRGGRRSRRRGAADRPERQGHRLRRRAEPRFLGRSLSGSVQLAHARRRRLAWIRRGRGRPLHCRQEGHQGGLDDSRRGAGTGTAASRLRPRELRGGRLDRRRDARGLRPPDRTASVQEGRQARPDPRRVQARGLRAAVS